MQSGDQSFYQRSYHNLNFINLFFFGRLVWFTFNNWGLALGINLAFYNSVAKGLKVKARILED